MGRPSPSWPSLLVLPAPSPGDGRPKVVATVGGELNDGPAPGSAGRPGARLVAVGVETGVGLLEEGGELGAVLGCTGHAPAEARRIQMGGASCDLVHHRSSSAGQQSHELVTADAEEL